MPKTRVLIAFALAVVLAGCGSIPEMDGYYQALEKMQAAQPPLLVMEAREGEEITLGGVKRLEVNAPARAGQYANIQPPRIQYHPAWQLGASVLQSALPVAGAAFQAHSDNNRAAANVSAVTGLGGTVAGEFSSVFSSQPPTTAITDSTVVDRGSQIGNRNSGTQVGGAGQIGDSDSGTDVDRGSQIVRERSRGRIGSPGDFEDSFDPDNSTNDSNNDNSDNSDNSGDGGGGAP